MPCPVQRIAQPAGPRPAYRPALVGVAWAVGFLALLATPRASDAQTRQIPKPTPQRPSAVPVPPPRPQSAAPNKGTATPQRGVGGEVVSGTGADDPERTSQGDGPPIRLTCVAAVVPAPVHVAAVIPRDADGNPTWAGASPLNYRFEWDFGDPDGRRNRLPGWNAAHVYDKPGQYTITLTVTAPDGAATRRTTWVRVAPDDRRRVFVSAAGNDGATGAGPTQAVKTAAKAFQLASADAVVLFRRGDIFDIASTIPLNGHNLRVGGYDGSADPQARIARVGPVPEQGPPPVLRKVDGPPRQDGMFFVGKGARDVLFEGIDFDSQWGLDSEYGPKKVPARAFTVGGINFAVRDCVFRNLTDAVNTETRAIGVLVQDSTFTEAIRGYCYWGNGTDHVVIGNVMTHSRQEHHIRASEPGVERLLVAYNDLSRPNITKGGIDLRDANWFYVAANHETHGSMRVGPQDVGIDKAKVPNWAEIKCTWGVIQDNRFDNVFVHVRLGSEHVMVRNNTVRMDDRTWDEWAFITPCEQKGWDEVRKLVDVTIEHNTVFDDGTKGRFLFVQGRPVSLTVRNNVYVAPNLVRNPGGTACAIYATDPEMRGMTVEGNVWPPGAGGVNFVGKGEKPPQAWAAQPGVKGERWQTVGVDADDNPPAGLKAGAKMGTDKRERDARKRAAAGADVPPFQEVAPKAEAPVGGR